MAPASHSLLPFCLTVPCCPCLLEPRLTQATKALALSSPNFYKMVVLFPQFHSDIIWGERGGIKSFY